MSYYWTGSFVFPFFPIFLAFSLANLIVYTRRVQDISSDESALYEVVGAKTALEASIHGADAEQIRMAIDRLRRANNEVVPVPTLGRISNISGVNAEYARILAEFHEILDKRIPSILKSKKITLETDLSFQRAVDIIQQLIGFFTAPSLEGMRTLVIETRDLEVKEVTKPREINLNWVVETPLRKTIMIAVGLFVAFPICLAGVALLLNIDAMEVFRNPVNFVALSVGLFGIFCAYLLRKN